ncbi:MAG: hypothetical protein HC897_10075 [Thermoanaerobaculia bacterium]|nr:hypothetical protein [Thermoanaerobaculia bacterium]
MSLPSHSTPRGRWAPTPSGLLHVGNARTALVAWLSIRKARGTLVFRLEDLDGPRTVRGMAEAGAEDLCWLGLDWDEGPEAGGAFGPYVQSQRDEIYERALERLAAAGRGPEEGDDLTQGLEASQIGRLHGRQVGRPLAQGR